MTDTSHEHGPQVTQAPEQHRFEIAVDGERAGLAAYVDSGAQRIFYHTEIDEKWGGRGLAAPLVTQALEATRGSGLRIVPVCPYVAKFVKSHHDFDDVLDRVTPQALNVVRAATDG